MSPVPPSNQHLRLDTFISILALLARSSAEACQKGSLPGLAPYLRMLLMKEQVSGCDRSPARNVDDFFVEASQMTSDLAELCVARSKDGT